MAESTSMSDTSVEADCEALKDFLSEILKDRATLNEEFQQLTSSSQLIIQQMEDDDSDEDDLQAEGRLHVFQAEKLRLDHKLRELEEKLKMKDEQMAELDAKASEYLVRVTTSSNSIFDDEEEEDADEGAEADEEVEANTEANAGAGVNGEAAEDTGTKAETEAEVEAGTGVKVETEAEGSDDAESEVTEEEEEEVNHVISAVVNDSQSESCKEEETSSTSAAMASDTEKEEDLSEENTATTYDEQVDHGEKGNQPSDVNDPLVVDTVSDKDEDEDEDDNMIEPINMEQIIVQESGIGIKISPAVEPQIPSGSQSTWLQAEGKTELASRFGLEVESFDCGSVGDRFDLSSVCSEQILSLSTLVAELRRVKDDMGKCMTVKEKTFYQLEDELVIAKKDQTSLKQQVSSMITKIEKKDKKFQLINQENKNRKQELEQKKCELQSSAKKCNELIGDKEQLESKLRVLEMMMDEYRAEIETVTGEKTQVEEQAKELAKEIIIKNENELSDKDMDNSDDDIPDDSSGDKCSGDDENSTGDNIDDDLTPEDAMEEYSILEDENRKLSEKLRSTSKYLKALARDREVKRRECEVLQEKVQLVECKMMQLQGTFDTLVAAVMVERDDLVKECENKSDEMLRLSQLVKQHQQREELNKKAMEEEVSQHNEDRFNNAAKDQHDECLKEDHEQQRLLDQAKEVHNKCVEEETAKLNEVSHNKLKKQFEEEYEQKKNELEKKIIEMIAEKQQFDEQFKNDISTLEMTNKFLEGEVYRLKSEVTSIDCGSDDSTKILNDEKDVVSQLEAKLEQIKTLENKLDSVSSDMNEFVDCLKEEMARMKEDMTKQGEARLKLEIAYDTLSEESRELLMEKKKFEDMSVELSITLSEHKSLVESLREQVEDLSNKNTSLTCEFHEKDEEYNEELRAREATIQELRITLTNNQKQSAENYQGLREDTTARQEKMVKQIEELMNSVGQLQEDCSTLTQQKKQLEEQKNEMLQKSESVKEQNGVANSGHDEATECNVEKSFGGKLLPKELADAFTGSIEELEKELLSTKDELLRITQFAVGGAVQKMGEVPKQDEVQEIEEEQEQQKEDDGKEKYTRDQEEEKDEEDGIQDEEIDEKHGEQDAELKEEIHGGQDEVEEQEGEDGDMVDNESAGNRAKIASMVQRIEELSGVLAATRIRRGLPASLLQTSASSVISTASLAIQRTSVSEGTSTTEEDISTIITKSVLVTDEKSTGTWSPFATQEEFEVFVAEHEKKIAELEEKVCELEKSLALKSGHINDLQGELDGARGKITVLQGTKTFQEHLDEINLLNTDITKLKEDLGYSQGECVDLKSTIAELESQKVKCESEKEKIVDEIESKLEIKGESESKSEDLELKKNLDERLKFILSTVESRIIGSVLQVESVSVFKVAEVESLYESRIMSIKNEYNNRIKELQINLDNAVLCEKENTCKYESERNLLREQLEEVNSKFVSITNDKNLIEEKLKLSENKIHVLNEVKKKISEYAKTLEEKIEACEAESRTTVVENDDNIQKLSLLTKENDNLRVKINTILGEKNENEKCLADLEKEKVCLSEQLRLLEKTQALLLTQRRKAVEEYVNLEKNLHDLKSGKSELASEVNLLKNTVNNCEEEKLHLQSVIELLQKEKSVFEILKIELEENLLTNESESIANKFKSEELFLINNALQKDISLLDSTISNLEADKSKLTCEIGKLKKAIAGPLDGKVTVAEDSKVTENQLEIQETEEFCEKNGSGDTEKSSVANGKSIESIQELSNQNKVLNERIAALEKETAIIGLLTDKIKSLEEDNLAIIKRYQEEQERFIEMQNMMVTDLETFVLNLEADKKQLEQSELCLEADKKQLEQSELCLQEEVNSLKSDNSILVIKVQELGCAPKMLEENLHLLKREKTVLIEDNVKLRTLLVENGGHEDLLEQKDENKSNAELSPQAKDLQKKLSVVLKTLQLKEEEYLQKLLAEQGDLAKKLQSLRDEMTEEMDIVETRNDEETEELVVKFAHLEHEFTTKLAETNEYYEVLLSEEKAEFGRVLVLKIDEYEKMMGEKNDEITGWKTKLYSMQNEVGGKMTVIEELEERLEGLAAAHVQLKHEVKHSQTPNSDVDKPTHLIDSPAHIETNKTYEISDLEYSKSQLRCNEISESGVLIDYSNIQTETGGVYPHSTFLSSFHNSQQVSSIRVTENYDNFPQSSTFKNTSTFDGPIIIPAIPLHLPPRINEQLISIPDDLIPRGDEKLGTRSVQHILPPTEPILPDFETLCDDSVDIADSTASHFFSPSMESFSTSDNYNVPLTVNEVCSRLAESLDKSSTSSLSECSQDISPTLNKTINPISGQRPILSLVIPTTFSDDDSSSNSSSNSSSSLLSQIMATTNVASNKITPSTSHTVTSIASPNASTSTTFSSINVATLPSSSISASTSTSSVASSIAHILSSTVVTLPTSSPACPTTETTVPSFNTDTIPNSTASTTTPAISVSTTASITAINSAATTTSTTTVTATYATTTISTTTTTTATAK